MGVAFIGCFNMLSQQKGPKVLFSIFISSSKTNRQGKFRGDKVFSVTNTTL